MRDRLFAMRELANRGCGKPALQIVVEADSRPLRNVPDDELRDPARDPYTMPLSFSRTLLSPGGCPNERPYDPAYHPS